jgi:hypothetical protein
MTSLRRCAAACLSRGVISRGWDSILTGLALIYVAWLLLTAYDADAAAPFVGVVLAVLGIRCLDRGIRAEARRHRSR